MKHSWFLRFYVCAAGVLAAVVVAPRATMWLSSSAVHGAVAQPFYSERGLYERNQSGVLSMYARDTLARTSDGRTALVQENGLDKLPPGVKFPPVRKVTLLDGSSVWLMDSLRLKTSWPKGTSSEARSVLARMSNHAADCGFDQSRIIGRETIGGQSTVVGTTDIDAVRQLTAWYAPGLGCETLQHKITLKDDGTVTVESRLLTLVMGEPNPSLFDLGDSYREVPPSEFMEQQLQAIGQTMDADTRVRALRLDREQKQVARTPTPQ